MISEKWRMPVIGAFVVAVVLLVVGGLDWPQMNASAVEDLAQSGGQAKPKPPQEQDEVVNLRGSLVTLGVRATDGKSRDVHGLKAPDFSVYENGTLQKITFFSEEPQPVSLGLLLDKSGSMLDGAKIVRAKTAAVSLVKASHPGNEFLYIPFDHEVTVAVNFTTDREPLETAISKTYSAGGGTSLYDAILVGLDRLAKARHQRQVLVAITDGTDQHSQHTLDDVIERLQASQAQLYLIGYFSKEEAAGFRDLGETFRLINGQEVDNPLFAFKRLAEESGAEYFFPKSDDDLSRAVEFISNDLQRQYTLAYYPADTPTAVAYRQIEVKVKRGGVKIRTRRGYRLSEETSESPTAEAKSTDKGRRPSRERTNKFESKVERKEGRIIYREDFSDPASGWPEAPSSFYSRGEYHLKNERAQASVVTNGPVFRDFRASAFVELKENPVRQVDPQNTVFFSSFASGLVFRASDKGYYAFLVGLPRQGRGQFKLIKQIGNLLVELIRWTPDPRITWRSKLGIVCQGAQIELYINGQLVGTVTDHDFKEGVMGLVLTEKGHAVFDDLTVEEIQ
jgi:VWFA-related protein